MRSRAGRCISGTGRVARQSKFKQARISGPALGGSAPLDEPYCGKKTPCDYSVENANSYAVLPLKTSHVIGALVLASAEEGKFFDGMGTLYIKRIGELVSAALLPHLK